MKVLKSLLIAVGIVIAEIVLWFIGIIIASKTGNWVGGSHIPIPREAEYAAAAPSVVSLIAGIVLIILGIKRPRTLLAGGVASLLMGPLQLFAAAYALAMAHIG